LYGILTTLFVVIDIKSIKCLMDCGAHSLLSLTKTTRRPHASLDFLAVMEYEDVFFLLMRICVFLQLCSCISETHELRRLLCSFLLNLLMLDAVQYAQGDTHMVLGYAFLLVFTALPLDTKGGWNKICTSALDTMLKHENAVALPYQQSAPTVHKAWTKFVSKKSSSSAFLHAGHGSNSCAQILKIFLYVYHLGNAAYFGLHYFGEMRRLQEQEKQEQEKQDAAEEAAAARKKPKKKNTLEETSKNMMKFVSSTVLWTMNTGLLLHACIECVVHILLLCEL